MQNREELRQKGHNRPKKKSVARGENSRVVDPNPAVSVIIRNLGSGSVIKSGFGSKLSSVSN
jgi:hypothetical protein